MGVTGKMESPASLDTASDSHDPAESGASSDQAQQLVQQTQPLEQPAVLVQDGSHFVTAIVTLQIDDESGGATSDSPGPLPKALETLAQQTRSVDAIIVVARSEAARARAVEAYGPYFDVALKADGPNLSGGVIDVAQAAGQQIYGETSPTRTWCWLLDAETQLADDCLESLLSTAAERPDAAVVGAKQLLPGDPPHLVDVGYTQTAGSRVIANGDTQERDQGQRDNERDVLGVSHRGCLLRWDVAQQLKGKTPGLEGLAAMIEYCVRARRLGHAVVVSPAAKVFAENRQHLTRRDHTRLRMMHTPLWLLPLAAVMIVLGGLARLFGRILVKEPRRGLTDLRQSWASATGIQESWPARRAFRQTFKEHRLDTPAESPRQLRLSVTESLRWHRDRFRRSFWGDQVKTLSVADTLASGRRHVPGVLTSIAILGLALYTWWPFVTAGQISGGAIGLAPSSVASLWEAGWSTHRDVALGTNGPGDPALGLWSVISWLCGGEPRWAIIAALVLTPGLAAASMWLATRSFVHNTYVRLWAMLTWAGLPLITMTLAAGQISTAAAVAAAPAYLWAVARTLPARTNREALGPVSLAGLIGAAITALSPPLGLAVLAGALGVAITKPKPRFARWWHVVVTGVLLVPFVSQAVTMGSWRAMLAEVGVAQTATRRSAMEWFAGYPFTLPDWTILSAANVPNGVGYWLPMALGWALPVAAVVSVLVTFSTRGNRARMCALGGVMAMVGVITGASLSYMWATSDGSYRLSVPHTPWVGLALLGAVLMAAAGLDWIASRLTTTEETGKAMRRVVKSTQVLAIIVVLLIPLGVLAGTASDRAVRQPQVQALNGNVLPLVAQDAAKSSWRTRTLVLRPTDGGVRAAVVRAEGLTLAGTNTSASSATRRTETQSVADRALTEAVAVVVGGKTDPRSVLTPLGIGFVTVAAGPQSEKLVETLNGVQGLDYAAELGGAHTWWVRSAETSRQQTPIAAAMVFEGVGKTRPFAALSHNKFQDRVAAGERERLVTLAEPFDARWQGTVDGQPLRAERVNGWAQGFWVPASGGEVTIEWVTPVRDALRWVQLGVIVFALLLLLPVVRTRGHGRSPHSVKVPRPRSGSEKK